MRLGDWLTARRVDLLLAVAATVAAGTGLASWAMGTGWARWLTVVHALAGLSLLALAPAKLRGSVRTGLKRRRPTRWLSMLLGALVTATVVLGVLHATGLWHGVGYWSALWTHVLLAALLAPLLVWHIVSRPGRPKAADLDRRALIGGGVALAAAGAVYWIQQLAVGDNRRFTGSHEIASFNPADMPTTMWLNDQSPRVAASHWDLTVAGEPVTIEALGARAVPVTADLDCTGGWWSRQSWDAVPLAELMGSVDAPTLEVTSLTGYSRLFPARDVANLYLAVGYSGKPLRRGHGAPVRLVAPGRRGFWWVKWVTRIDPVDRPWWLQLPFPLE
ncbi:molybdopterin-dependent oxidoreductase [Candidatus Poriferisodalis sp.]|uniref:molybdopterin-dependent oxidoreductase n=1 Tax=Candidatus Poriferisodalis sp. TaxID=3101277 RepID=UPI003B51F437